MENYKFTNYQQPEDRFTKSVSILTIIVLVYLILYVVTFAWFGESKLATSPTIVVGSIELDVTHNYDFGQNKLEPYKIYEDTETTIKTVDVIDAYIKVKLETDKTVTTPDSSTEFLVKPNFSEPNDWKIGSDGWYYYIGFINNTQQANFNLQATRYLTVNDIGLPFEISLTIHAIQKDYLDVSDFDNTESELYEWRNAPQEFLDYIDSF